MDNGIGIVRQFNDALNLRDVAAMMRCLTPDCVFENTSPAPDGERYVSKAAVQAFWEEFFRSSLHARIEIEEIFEAGERVWMRWIYRWVDNQGSPGHVRGIDEYLLKDGLIAQKLSYVKG